MNPVIPGVEEARRALNHIPEMAGASVVDLFSDGPSNRSYRVEHQNVAYLLRLDKPGVAWMGLDRENEKRVSKTVSAAGLAPGYLFFEPGEGICIRRYVAGRSWTPSDLENPENLDRLAALLRELHHLDPIGTTFEPLAAARRYANQLDNRGAHLIVDELELLANKIHAVLPRQAICHNDLLCQNIFEGDHLMLIDWEYTGVGDPFFDLAVIVQHHELRRATATVFLKSYLQRPATPDETHHLNLQCRFYAHLLQLWYQIHP